MNFQFLRKENIFVLFDAKSRTGRFFRTLGGAYTLLGTATLYSFLTIPMILHFGGKEVLGMWLLIVQITGYLTSIDAGLSSSSVRQFVGPVVASAPEKLAPRFQATLVISLFQGIFIILVALGGVNFVVKAWQIPTSLKHDFIFLFLAQSFLLGLTFPLRTFSSVLLAAQKFSLNYFWNAIFLLLAIVLGWIGFYAGWGIWGLFLGNLLIGFGQFFFSVYGVAKMRFLPFLFRNWLVTGSELRKVAKESLFFASGPLFSTFAGLIQSTVLSRCFGLEGVALWNIGAKIAMIFAQILSKVFESSFSGLSELLETSKRSLMLQRFGQIVGYCFAACAAMALFLLLFNDWFISVWTSGKVSWPIWGTWWVGLLLLISTFHQALAEAMKMLVLWRAIRTTPFLDFCFFSSAMVFTYITDRFSVFVAAVVLAPYFFGICFNMLAFRKAIGHSFWSLIPKPFTKTLFVLYLIFFAASVFFLFN